MEFREFDYIYQGRLFENDLYVLTDDQEAYIEFGKLLESGEIKEWENQYERLRELGYPWNIAVYIAWAASPKNNRYPATKKELLKIIPLPGDQKWYYKREIKKLIIDLQSSELFEKRGDVIKALIESAMTPGGRNHNDRKLFLEMMGDYKSPGKVIEELVNGIGKSLTQKSDIELIRMIEEEDNG